MSENPTGLKRDLDRALTNAPCVIVMVGLPARGKTYIARKLTRYLNWVGITTKVFNVGQYRRVAAPESITRGSEFFRNDNQEARDIREKCAAAALDDLNRWLKSGAGEVAVYDATNSVRSRRQMICDYIVRCGYKVFFVESVCFDPTVIEANIREVKLSSPDYVNIDAEKAIEDFRQRIRNYEEQYESLDVEYDRDLSFIKIFDQGVKYVVNGVRGHIESRCVYYLMNIHVLPRTIYLTRHAETEMNVSGRIGAESDLTSRGLMFAQALAQFVAGQNGDIPLKVWSGLHRESIATASFIDAEVKESWKTLNEIDCGICEGLTYDEMQARFPDELELRDIDKYYYRYPSGESYQDLVTRLEPVIMELERSENVMVVCHQAVMRCLLAYFVDKGLEDLPYLEVPLHTVLKLTPVAYGCKIEQITFGIEAVSTHRPRPSNLPRFSEAEIKTRRRRSSGARLEPLAHRRHRHQTDGAVSCSSVAEPCPLVRSSTTGPAKTVAAVPTV